MSDEKIAITANGEIPMEQLLGHLVILVHHNFDMPIAKMDKLMDEVKFPQEYRPRAPGDKHAFQAATRDLQTTYPTKEKFVDPDNMLELFFNVEYFIDILPNGSRQLSRKIQYSPESKEGISEGTKKILAIYVEKTQKEPEKMAVFDFDDATKEVKMTPLYSEKKPLYIDEMTSKKFEELKKRYETLRGSYTERYLKQAWVEMMFKLNAVPYCGSAGATWFVPKEGKRYVDAFGRLYYAIHEKISKEPTWRVIPAIDTKAQRKYILEDVQSELKKRYEKYLENLGERLEKIKTQEDLEKLRNNTAEKTQKMESEMNNTLIQKYSSLLKTSINIKLDNVKQQPNFVMSARMKRAMRFLETGE
jgi:hypothetical protein